MLNTLSPAKPFKSYAELAALLVSRGMELDDSQRAERKLAQVGYYRLSGFWFPCREFKRDTQGKPLLSSQGGKPIRENRFMPGTPIGPNAGWRQQVADLIDTRPCLPGCHFASMGFPDEAGFPRNRFGI